MMESTDRSCRGPSLSRWCGVVDGSRIGSGRMAWRSRREVQDVRQAGQETGKYQLQTQATLSNRFSAEEEGWRWRRVVC